MDIALKIKNNVSWVGKIDWELRKFHGDEYSSHRFLLRGGQGVNEILIH